MHLSLDYNETPLLVIWETTRACGLACKHCRAEAIPDRHPAELSFREGKELLDAIHCLGTPLVVFSGGDPLQRPDLDGLIRYANSLGLRTGTIPAATSLLTASRVRLLKEEYSIQSLLIPMRDAIVPGPARWSTADFSSSGPVSPL